MSADPRFTRNALLLWAAQFISASGDALFLPCLAWIAGRTSDGQIGVGLAVFIVHLPYLLLGPLAGAWVDRSDRRRIMVISDLLRSVLLLGLPFVAAWWGGMDFALIAVVGFLLASFSTPFGPARDALLPTIVGQRSLPRWNAIIQTSGQFAMIAGLVLGGLLLGDAGEADGEIERVLWVLQIDGATFLVSALLLMFLVLPKDAAAPRKHRPLLREVAEGLTYARRDRVVLGLLVLTALNNLAIMGPAIVGAALLVKDEFGLGPAQYAWFEGGLAGGMVVGSLILAWIGRAWSERRIVLSGMIFDGVTFLPFVWAASYASSLPWIVLHGVGIPFLVVGRTSLIQRHVPAHLHGKVFALVGITVIGMTAVSCALSGFIAAATSPRMLYGIAGVFGTLCGLAGCILWRVPEAEEPTP